MINCELDTITRRQGNDKNIFFPSSFPSSWGSLFVKPSQCNKLWMVPALVGTSGKGYTVCSTRLLRSALRIAWFWLRTRKLSIEKFHTRNERAYIKWATNERALPLLTIYVSGSMFVQLYIYSSVPVLDLASSVIHVAVPHNQQWKGNLFQHGMM